MKQSVHVTKMELEILLDQILKESTGATTFSGTLHLLENMEGPPPLHYEVNRICRYGFVHGPIITLTREE
jgi:hypothetical protein